MLRWLISHNLKSIRRSPDFHRQAAAKGFVGVMLFFVALEMLFLGFFLNRILSEDLAPGESPVGVLNGAIGYFIAFDLLLRITFQKRRWLAVRQYVLLRIGRSSLVHFVLAKTLLTLFNLWPLLIVVPFFFRAVVPLYGGPGSLAWFLSILGILVFDTYVANYAKLRFFTNAARTSLAVSGVAVLVVLEILNVVSLSGVSRTVFGSFLQTPLLGCLPLVAVMAVYWENHRYLMGNLYQGSTQAISSRKSFREHFGFLRGFGEIGTLISLDLKLMLRNKRARMSLWMPALFVFYGLMFYPRARHRSGDAFMDFMMMFIGIFITGFYIMSYGLNTFSYESKHFGVVLTNKIDMLTYLKAKYYSMVMFTIPVYLASLGYLYFGNRVFVINSTMFLFNIGVVTFFFLFLATYNRMKFDLDAGMMSMQGKGGNQFVAVFLLILFLLALTIPLRLLTGPDITLIIMGLLGIAGVVFHEQMLKLLVRQFFRKKYIMAEGFRQT